MPPNDDFGDPLADYAEFMFPKEKTSAPEPKTDTSDASEAGKRLAAERKRESAFKSRSKPDSEPTPKEKGAPAGKRDEESDESDSAEDDEPGDAKPAAT